jgi:transcriptional regulator with XRE-family HTH domain
MSDKDRASLIAARIKGVRDDMALNQTGFAALFEVDQSIISKWERGSEMPTVKHFIRLGNLSREYSDKKIFWEQAGIELAALDQFADQRTRSKGASASEFRQVPSLDPKAKEVIQFDSRLLDNPASTRAMRISSSRESFKIGDIRYDPPTWPTASNVLLIDPGQSDLRKIAKGELIAVRIKSPDGKRYHDYVGNSLPSFQGDGTSYWLDLPAGDRVYIGRSVGSLPSEQGPVKLAGLDSVVHGTVVAWIKKEKKS